MRVFSLRGYLLVFVFLQAFGRLHSAETVIFYDGFEEFDSLTNRWVLSTGDLENTSPYPSWEIVNASFGGEGAYGGTNKAYCAGRGYLSNRHNPIYPTDYWANMRIPYIDLRRCYPKVTLSFWYKLKMPDSEIFFDAFTVFANEQTVFDTFQLSTSVPNWTQVVIPLNQFAGGFCDLRFEFISDFSNEACTDIEFCAPVTAASDFEGVYIDDILITGDVIKCESIALAAEQALITFSGVSNTVYRIETSTNLQQWTAVTNLLATNSLFQINDSVAGFSKYYRARSP